MKVGSPTISIGENIMTRQHDISTVTTLYLTPSELDTILNALALASIEPDDKHSELEKLFVERYRNNDTP